MASLVSYQWNHDFSKLARDSGFAFKAHNSSVVINWNDIRVIDIDRVVQERDFRTIDDHLYQVLECQLEKEFDVRILDRGFVKLFRLAQLSVEYLLHCRRHLDITVPLLRAQIKQMEEDTESLKKQLRYKEEEIRRLRNKTRKQQKTMDYVKNSDIANLLKRMAMNEGQVGMSSMGDQALKSFHKCLHCDKVFLNQFYQHSHIVRRHPNLPSFEGEGFLQANSTNSSPQHEAKYRQETERLLQEIKELKDRVNVTEKQLQSKANDNNDIENNYNKDGGVNNSSNENNNIKKTDKVESDAVEKDAVTLAVFEEWKKAEQSKFLEQLEVLKRQLADSVTVVKEREIAKETAKDNEEIVAMTKALKQHEAEVITLKEHLKEKVSLDLSELKSNLEVQERLWQQKLQKSEEDHRLTVEELKTSLLKSLTESQSAQEQYRSRIDILESSAREQKRILEDQSRKLSVVGSSPSRHATMMNPIGKTTPLETQRRMRAAESHETLPPYDEGSSEESFIKPKPFVTTEKLHKSYTKDLRAKIKKTTRIPDSESDETPMVEELKLKLPKNNNNINKRKKDYTKKIGQNSATSSDSSLGKINKISLPKDIRNEKLQGTKNNAVEISPAKNMKGKRKGEMRAARNEEVKNSAVNLREKSQKKSHQKEKSDSKNSDNSLSNSSDPVNRPSGGKNLMKAVKSDLALIVDKRLEQLGVPLDKSGLPVEAFEKNMAAVEHRRHLVAKKHGQFDRIRKGISSALDEKVKAIKTKRSPSSDVTITRSNASLNKIGSILNSVKNKALAIMKSRENLADNNNDRESSARRRSLSEIIEDTYKTSPVKTNISPNKKSVLSAMNDIFNQKKQIEVNTSTENMRVSLSESFTETDTSSSDEEVKSDTRQNVTKVVSHASSKSLETLLISPIRRPGRTTTNEENVSVMSSTPTKRLESVSNALENISNNGNNNRISKSEDNIPSMYAGATSTSGDSDLEEKRRDFKKSVSEENVHKVTSQKSVLKSAVSAGSLSKKKVIFDLDANEMKSVSASPTISASAAIEVKAVANWETRASANTDSDSEWDISNVEPDLEHHSVTIHPNPSDEIKLSTRQSPKIAEISKTIGLQLGARVDKPPTGGIEAMFQNKLTQELINSPKKSAGNIVDNVAGDVANIASTSRVLQNQPIAKPRTVVNKRNALDSDLELSDWSLDDLLHDK